MPDLRNAKLIYLKGLLFLLGGVLASTAILLDSPTWRTAGLLALTVWCFARFYYFTFYAIEKYVDPTYRFAGLWSFARFVLKRRSGGT